MRIGLVLLLTAAPVILTSPARAASARDPGRPNVLLLVAEDMGPRVGAFGDSLTPTPNLDRLAAQGVRFDHVFTTAGVCAPSRAALITGMHQNAIGAGHMRSSNFGEAPYRAVPPPEVKAFPELLRAAGYFTYVNTKLDYQFSGVMPGTGPFTVWDAESSVFDAVSWRDRPDDRPFFGMYAFMETHEGGLFPRCCWPRSRLQLAMALLHLWLHRGTGDSVSPGEVMLPPYYPDTPAIRRDVARQYENIRTMDARVGELLARLEADGLADDTIVIWTTDHGDGLPRAKRELFDSGIRVPMIVRWPERYRPEGLAPGSVDHRLVSFVDLAPQILGFAGVPAPGWIQGRPFLAEGARRYVFAARDRIDAAADRQRAVRDDRYKLIRNFRPGTPGALPNDFRDHLDSMRSLRAEHEAGRLDAAQRRWFEARPEEELYDLTADPHEVHDLARDPEYADVLARLRAELDAWLAGGSDLGAIPERELAERFWPGGTEPVTEAPRFRSEDGRLVLSSPTRGASIGYRLDDGPWQLYVAALARPAPGTRLEAKAVRYGFAESRVVRFEGDD